MEDNPDNQRKSAFFDNSSKNLLIKESNFYIVTVASGLCSPETLGYKCLDKSKYGEIIDFVAIEVVQQSYDTCQIGIDRDPHYVYCIKIYFFQHQKAIFSN